jgi:hexosaminidase
MLKRFLFALFLWFYSIGIVVASPIPSQAIFTLEKNNPDKTFSATIIVKNNENYPIKNWQLAFSFIRSITEIRGGKVSKNISYYYIISPDKPVIPAHDQYVFHIKGKSHIEQITDTPTGYFLILTNSDSHKQSTLSLDEKNILPLESRNEYWDNIKKNQTSIEHNPVLPSMTVDQSLIVPLPAVLERLSGTFIVNKNTSILIDSNALAAKKAAQFFIDVIAPATDYHLKLKLNKIGQPTQKNTILFTQNNADSTLGEEGYILQITPDNIVIRAKTDAGFFYAIQSLRQLLPPAIFDNKKTSQTVWNIPCVTIRDYPRFHYRGLSLDTARHFISPDQVKRLIDLMSLHKLNYFQWHLTDDEGWRVEIKKYPTLTSIGAWRGYDKAIPPVLGTGAKPYGGYYSQAEIRDVIQYAKERHITIIPEIDIPGHARAMLMSLPELIDKDDKSRYTTAQDYHDNLLSPCMENTFVVIDNIMTEIAALFPSDIIHIGSDEVPDGAWIGSPRCQTFMKSLGIHDKNGLQKYFLMRVKNIIQSKNKTMAVWDDAITNGDFDTSTRVYSWTNEKAGFDAAKRGFPVVLMPASYLYFDLAYNDEPTEPGYYWAGRADTFKVYSYQPIDASWPATITHNILGIQGALWTENVPSISRLDYLIFPKLLALSEVAWTAKERRNWINFSERVGRLHLPRLNHYGVAYRVSPPGLNVSKKMLEANVEFPGLSLRYTKNGMLPTMDSSLYEQPIEIDSSIIMQSFSDANHSSRAVTLKQNTE